jgi:hypothetical protein
MTPPLYDELCKRGIGLLMKMSSVGKSNHGKKPTPEIFRENHFLVFLAVLDEFLLASVQVW